MTDLQVAKNKLTSYISSLATEQVVAALRGLNMAWNEYAPEQRTVRSHLLSEYEQREGGEAVDALMDELDAELEAKLAS